MRFGRRLYYSACEGECQEISRVKNCTAVYKEYADEVLLSSSAIFISVSLMLGVGFRLMHRSVWMLWRRVERIELQRTVPNVDDVVPRAGRNDDCIIPVHARFFAERMTAAARMNLGVTTFDADKLVNVFVHFNPNVAANGDTHKRELHIASRPKRGTEIAIHVSRVADIEYKRLGTVVAHFGMPAAVVVSHIDTSLLGTVSIYARLTCFDKA